MSLPFSERSAVPREPNRLALAVAGARAAGRPLTDLAGGNPTHVGLERHGWQAALDVAEAARYEPAPLGLEVARAAVARYYAARGEAVDAERVVLSASTSEAYSWLFKLLCDPGDRVLVPRPAYPLLPLLSGGEAVGTVGYRLLRDERWRVDLADVRRALAESGAKAIVLVHPGNPTGAFTRRDDAAALARLAAEQGVPLIVDEVFSDYVHDLDERYPSFVSVDQGLCFVLSGLSKVALLPQAKLGWTVVTGAPHLVGEALARLEIIADGFLSVATPVQLAAPALLDDVEAPQRALRRRIAQNLRCLDQAIAELESCPVRRLPSDGGWYAMLEVPRTRTDDEWIEELVWEAGVIVHPGYFFDLDGPGTMVVSLIPPPDDFAPAIRRAIALWAT